MSEIKDDDEPSIALLAELPTSTAWRTLEELKFDAAESPDLKFKNDMIMNEFNVVKPPPLITWERAKSLFLGVVALFAASMVLVAAFVAVYLLLTNLLSPAKLHYHMPLPLDLEGHDLVSNVTFMSLDQYSGDGHVWNADDIGDDALVGLLLGQGKKFDAWLEISVPNEYERSHPERKFAHVTSELLSYQGKRVKRTSKPVMLNGRPSSALSLALGPWRWIGVVDRRHVVPVRLFKGHIEQRNSPTVFVSVRIQARSPPGPEILEVNLHVALRSGIVRKVLFYARPQSLVGKAMGLGAFLVISSGSLVLLLCLHFYFKAAQEDVPKDQDNGSTTSDGSSSLLTLSLDTPRGKSTNKSEASIGDDSEQFASDVDEQSKQTDIGAAVMAQPEASIRRRKT